MRRLTHEDLHIVCRNNTESLDQLTTVVLDFVNGRVPRGPVQDFLLRGRAVALQKPNDKPRPIDVLNLALGCLVRTRSHTVYTCHSRRGPLAG